MAQGRALALGESGEVETTVQRRSADGVWRKVDRWRTGDRVRARCYHRGFDGKVREVSRIAPTKVAAVAAVTSALSSTTRGAGSHLTAATKVADAVPVWVAQARRQDSGLSPKTVALYEKTAQRYVVDSPISSLRLDQLNPANLRSFLQGIADSRGTATAKLARSVLSGVMTLAVTDGVLAVDPLRSFGAVRGEGGRLARAADHSRAFTREERDALVAYLYDRASEQELLPRTARKRRAVADLLAFLAGTGARVDEARGLLWGDVNLNRGTVLIRGTKSASAWRTVTLPQWLTERLTTRSEETSPDVTWLVFPAPHRGDPEARWDQANSAHAIREALDDAGYPWAVSHTFRRTVASLAHESGIPLVRIADQLGHADPKMTASVYLGRDFMGERPDLGAVL